MAGYTARHIRKALNSIMRKPTVKSKYIFYFELEIEKAVQGGANNTFFLL